jgi:hypothetical protein
MCNRLLSACLALLLPLAGCLEFDAQEVTVRYDAEADRIDALIVYRGLFAEGGNGSSEKPIDKALKDLAEARETGEFTFWNNWPLSVDLTADRPAPVMALMQHVDVENGALFTDPQGVLCAYQFVRIRDAKAFLQKVNVLFEIALQAGLNTKFDVRGPDHQVDDDTKDFVREFLRSGQKLLLLEPGRMELRLPCSDRDHRWLKDQIEQHFLDNMPREIVRSSGVLARRAAGGEVTDTSIADAVVQIQGDQLRGDVQHAASFRFFWDNDLSIVREQELTRFGIGVAGAEQLRVKKAPYGLYHDLLLKTLRERGEAIEDGLPDQELARRFVQFRDRDAALPPKLAALRAPAKAATDGK